MGEWVDEDCPKCRAAFSYLLRAHVRHQDGRHSLAPTLVFADADYEPCDGSVGLHGDAKHANEPAIVFVRADQFIDATARIEALEARVAAADALAEWVEGIIEDGCPKCGGDCSAANPPVSYCPMQEAMSDLAAYQATKEGE